ncbi:MAG: hypothetical protein AB1831_06495 [Pseudomonadota bacterium]
MKKFLAATTINSLAALPASTLAMADEDTRAARADESGAVKRTFESVDAVPDGELTLAQRRAWSTERKTGR